MGDVSPTEDPTTPTKPLLSSATYDKIKFLVQVVLPAAAALYAGLAILWGFPNGTEVTGSIALLATFLSALLGVSNKSYEQSGAKYDGDLNVHQLPDGPVGMQVALDQHPAAFGDGQTVTLKVNKVAEPPIT